jgi:flagellar biosynthesis chaperone FliJ
MKPSTLARLDMLAAEQETQLLDAIRRHNATLEQTVHQRGMLASYRERLAASWQSGAEVQAVQARRAMQFVNASQGADAQITQAAQRAGEQLEAAITSLGHIQARRRALAEALRKLALQAERAAEQRMERDIPWRPAAGRIRRSA